MVCRLISVIESMDNGKPIRESRDLDIPLVARHFYHHAGTGVCCTDTFVNAEMVHTVSYTQTVSCGNTAKIVWPEVCIVLYLIHILMQMCMSDSLVL